MTRADVVRAYKDQVVELTAAAGAVHHSFTDRPWQSAYRSHTATIELTTAFPHAKNPMDLEHIRAALAQLAEVAPPTSNIGLSGLTIYANWTEELPS